MYQKIIVCVDDTPLSERVVRVGADLARRYGASIVLLSVVDSSRFARQAYSGLEAVHMVEQHGSSFGNSIHRLDAMLHKMGVRTRQVVLRGRSVETILKVAETESADLIIIGSEGRGRFHAWLNNDLWSELSHKASCNVLRVTPKGQVAGMETDPFATPSDAGHGASTAPVAAM